MPFERMFPPAYNQGYMQALLDLMNVLDGSLQDDLKFHKRKQNNKTYKAIIKCILDNHIAFREYGRQAFVRCNNDVEGGFEVYVEYRGVYKDGKIIPDERWNKK